MSPRPRHAVRARSLSLRPLHVFAIGAFASFAVMSVWSLSLPLFSGPDEQSQVAHASALVRGQWIGTPVPGYQNPYTRVVVPATLGNGYALMNCYKFNPTIPASCASHVHVSTAPAETTTYSGRYPPLYYALTGLPSLAVSTTNGVFLMRLLSSLLCSALFGLAFMVIAVWSRARALPAGFACALTPAAVYMGAVVNPNGLEIAAAVCLWTSVLVLATERVDDPPRALIVLIGVSGSILSLTRGLSPLWTIIALGTMVAIAGPRPIWRLLTTRRDAQWATGALVVSVAAAAIWILLVHSLWLVPAGPPVAKHATEAHIVRQAFGQTSSWLHQMVGVLGWLDTPLSSWTYWSWIVAVLALIAGGIWLGRPKTTVILAVLLMLTFVLPVAVELVNARTIDLAWEGRYTLPLAAGIPLLAAASQGVGPPGRVRLVLTRGIIVLLSAAGVLAFLAALRRYAVGTQGPLDFFGGPWHPVEGSVLAVIWCVAATGFFAFLLWRASGASGLDNAFAGSQGRRETGAREETPPGTIARPAETLVDRAWAWTTSW